MAKPTKQNDETPTAPFAAAPIEAAYVNEGDKKDVPVDARGPKEASFHIIPTGEANLYDVVLKVGGVTKYIERAQPISMCGKAVIANAAQLSLWAQGVRILETSEVG